MNGNGAPQIAQIPERPEATSRWRNAPLEVVQTNRVKIRRQLEELYDQEQGPCGPAVIRITCPCGERIPLMEAYRCLFCGIWFCKDCAEEHFTEGEGDDT